MVSVRGEKIAKKKKMRVKAEFAHAIAMTFAIMPIVTTPVKKHHKFNNRPIPCTCVGSCIPCPISHSINPFMLKIHTLEREYCVCARVVCLCVDRSSCHRKMFVGPSNTIGLCPLLFSIRFLPKYKLAQSIRLLHFWCRGHNVL
jgi:hypothetical protein